MEKQTKWVEYFPYEESDDTIARFIGPTTATIFYSQCGEDLDAYCNFFHNKRSWYQENEGVYIEIGASDGVKFSNTKFFEEDMGFTGILIEPEPTLYAKLTKTRPNNHLYNCAVDSSEQPVAFLVTSGAGGAWVSGIEKHMSDFHKESWHEDTNKIMVDTTKMSSIMKSSEVERVDLFSIDVEGGEYEVLKTTDWNIPIYVIIVELGTGATETEKDVKCRELLAEKGYTFSNRVGLSEIWYDEKYFEKVKDEEDNLV